MAKTPKSKAVSDPYTNDLVEVGEGENVRKVPAGGSVRLPGLSIDWQSKPGDEKGATLEQVIEAAAQRLRFFQEHFPSDENIDARVRLEQALEFLNARTARRKRLGIEGTYEPDVKPHAVRR